MRELTMVELEQVEGGNPVVVVGVVIGTIALAGVAVLAYAVHEQCSASMSISAEQIEIEVDCKPPAPTGG